MAFAIGTKVNVRDDPSGEEFIVDNYDPTTDTYMLRSANGTAITARGDQLGSLLPTGNPQPMPTTTPSWMQQPTGTGGQVSTQGGFVPSGIDPETGGVIGGNYNVPPPPGGVDIKPGESLANPNKLILHRGGEPRAGAPYGGFEPWLTTDNTPATPDQVFQAALASGKSPEEATAEASQQRDLVTATSGGNAPTMGVPPPGTVNPLSPLPETQPQRSLYWMQAYGQYIAAGYDDATAAIYATQAEKEETERAGKPLVAEPGGTPDYTLSERADGTVIRIAWDSNSGRSGRYIEIGVASSLESAKYKADIEATKKKPEAESTPNLSGGYTLFEQSDGTIIRQVQDPTGRFINVGPASSAETLGYMADKTKFANAFLGINEDGTIRYAPPKDTNGQPKTVIQDAYKHDAYWDESNATYKYPPNWGQADVDATKTMSAADAAQLDLLQKQINRQLLLDEESNRLNKDKLALERQIAEGQGKLTERDNADLLRRDSELQLQRDALEQQRKEGESDLAFERDKLAYQKDIDKKRLGIDQQMVDLEKKKAEGNLTPQDIAQLGIQQNQLALQRDQLAQEKELAGKMTPYQAADLEQRRTEFKEQGAREQQRIDIDRELADLDMKLRSGELITPKDQFEMDFRRQELEIQRESLKPPEYTAPDGSYITDRYGNKAYWNPRTADYDRGPEFGVDPATTAAGYVQPMTAYEQAQVDLRRQELSSSREASRASAGAAGAQTALAQERFRAEIALQKKQQEQEQQNYLAKLGAQPISWIEYAMATKTPPVVQPWMQPLMPQQYGQLQPGQVIPQGQQGQPQVFGTGAPLALNPTPEQIQQWAAQQPQGQSQGQTQGMAQPTWMNSGNPQGNPQAPPNQYGQVVWGGGHSSVIGGQGGKGGTGAFNPKNMPGLTTPSMQYWSRVGPTAQQEYLGYEQARTGAKPEETQWRLWQTAPPAGPALPVRYGG